jgi:SSS family solute:Na+ symporter
VLANLLVAVIVTLICRAAKAPDGVDATRPADYYADEATAAAPEPPLADDQLPEPVPTP